MWFDLSSVEGVWWSLGVDLVTKSLSLDAEEILNFDKFKSSVENFYTRDGIVESGVLAVTGGQWVHYGQRGEGRVTWGVAVPPLRRPTRQCKGGGTPRAPRSRPVTSYSSVTRYDSFQKLPPSFL